MIGFGVRVHRPTGRCATRSSGRVACAGLLLLCAALEQPARAQSAQARVLRDIAYVEPAHAEQHLDLYLPAGREFTTVLFIHGGSLVEVGERRASEPYRNMCDPFVAHGMACATIDYRLAPSFQWPAMPTDVARATRWIRDAVVEHGGDPARLFLFGHSSGCHLAALLATDSSYLAAEGLRTRDLAGFIAMGCTLAPLDTTGRGLTPDQLRERFARDRGDVEVYGNVDHRIRANPSLHLGRHVPPALVVVAREERFMPPILEQGARFVRRLVELGVRADLVIVPGTHMSSIAAVRAAEPSTLGPILDFIRMSGR